MYIFFFQLFDTFFQDKIITDLRASRTNTSKSNLESGPVFSEHVSNMI